MKGYYRVMLGRRSMYAEECFAGNFIGADFGIPQDLSHSLPEEWRAFANEFIPVYLAAHPEKTKIAAGLACGSLWTVCKGIKKGDIVLCPDGSGRYRIAEVSGDYIFQPGGILPHRRAVNWLDRVIDRVDMSDALKNSAGSIGTVSDLTRRYGDEIETLMGSAVPTLVSAEETVEDAAAFVLEKHLEDFPVEGTCQ